MFENTPDAHLDESAVDAIVSEGAYVTNFEYWEVSLCWLLICEYKTKRKSDLRKEAYPFCPLNLYIFVDY